ncbi:hypothetical protein JKP88DRAFT_229965 [Tribonema minus]|uniref:Secreted protein n=1 Tax=Tribonema minus TaxID=303371 RepID=A0A836CN27_9STRA|nr:hypothetical protein JKP88DRAFT_229965 [Tribonema minus]
MYMFVLMCCTSTHAGAQRCCALLGRPNARAVVVTARTALMRHLRGPCYATCFHYTQNCVPALVTSSSAMQYCFRLQGRPAYTRQCSEFTAITIHHHRRTAVPCSARQRCFF